MPKRLGINVSVTDMNGKPYTEYGLQNDNRISVKKSKVSTHIEAINNAQFRICVQVDNPFRFEQEVDRLAFGKAIDAALKSNPAPQVQSEHNTRTKHFDSNRPVEEELGDRTSPPPAVSTVPFDLMVSVFIDGRAKPECRQMIYLDPKHPRYNACCILKGRWVDPGDSSARDGKAGLLQWVFTDRGIDHILSKLDVKKVVEQTSDDPEELELKEICAELGTGAFEEIEDKLMKAGEIEVRLRRVISLESDPVDQKFKAYHYAGDDEKPRKVDDDCTHTTSFMPKTTSGGPHKIETFVLRHVAWKSFKKHEDAYARFIFKYTARYKLMNLGLSEHDGAPTIKGRKQDAAPDSSSRRGKKRAPSVDGSDDEEHDRPGAKKAPIFSLGNDGSKLGHDSDSSISEEDADNTASFYHGRGRYEMRATAARVDNYKKSRADDESNKIA